VRQAGCRPALCVEHVLVELKDSIKEIGGGNGRRFIFAARGCRRLLFRHLGAGRAGDGPLKVPVNPRGAFARQDILLVLDGAPNHRCGDLVVPANITLLYLPPYSPELNPKENLWDEIREKIFKNYALKFMDAVCAKLKQAVLYIERNPKLVRSITAFPYIINSL
jgi:transposase